MRRFFFVGRVMFSNVLSKGSELQFSTVKQEKRLKKKKQSVYNILYRPASNRLDEEKWGYEYV